MKKFTRVEKTIIALMDEKEYTTYECEKHGVFNQRNDIHNGECPYCKNISPKIENIEALRTKFKKELGYK